MTARVLWLTLGDRDVASSRVRAYSLSDALQRRGLESECLVGRGIGGRLRALARLAVRRADIVVIQKLLYGGAMLRLLRGRTQVLVWECDDALHVGSPGEPKPSVERSRRLIQRALRSADVVTTSNPLLADDLRPKSGKVVRFQGPAPQYIKPAGWRDRILVWLGSPSTQRYLSLLGDAPAALRAQGWDCVAVGATDAVAVYGWRPVAWSPDVQSEWLSRAVVGVMPQPPDPWSDRKQGYKLFEYMAHGVVPVASDVLPARIVLSELELRPLLVPEDGDWARAIDDALVLRDALAPALQRVLRRCSIESSLAAWLDAVGIRGAV